jgi:hypothetical protein
MLSRARVLAGPENCSEDLAYVGLDHVGCQPVKAEYFAGECMLSKHESSPRCRKDSCTIVRYFESINLTVLIIKVYDRPFNITWH